MQRIWKFDRRGDEKGASAIEYVLICALIAVVMIAGMTALGQRIGARLTTVTNAM